MSESREAASGRGGMCRRDGGNMMLRPRIVDELLVIADAAAAGEGWIVLPAGEGRIVLPRIVAVGGDDAAERLTFGYVELVARTYDDCPRAEFAGSEIFDLSSGVAFCLSRYDLKRFCVDIDAVIVGDC